MYWCRVDQGPGERHQTMSIARCGTREPVNSFPREYLDRNAPDVMACRPPCHPRPGSTSRPAPGQGCGGPASRRRWFPGPNADGCCCRRGMNCCCASDALRCVLSAAHRRGLSAAHRRGLSAAHRCGLVARTGGEAWDRAWRARQHGLMGAWQREPGSISIFILPHYSISPIR